MKKYKHIIYFLIFTLILHFTCRFYDLPGKSAFLLIVPFLYGLYHLTLSIIEIFKQKYLDSLCSLIKFSLFSLIVLKLYYEYYNFFLAFIILFCIGLFLLKKAWTHSSRQTLLSLLLLNCTLLFVPDSLILKYLNQYKTRWHNISLSEFKGTPNYNSNHGAEIYTGFKWKINRVYNYPSAIVIATMNPDNSWVRPELKENKETLLHEQFHFDITEYFRRFILDSLQSCWKCDYDQKISIIDYFGALKNKMQNDFDTLYVSEDTVNLNRLSKAICSNLDIPKINFHFFNNEKAVLYKRKIVLLSEIHSSTCQEFIDEAKSLLKKLIIDPDLAIDYDNIKSLSSNSIDISQRTIAGLDSINEIDENISFKSHYKKYVIATLNFLTDFEKYLIALRINRKDKKVEYLKENAYKRGIHMKEMQFEFKKAQELFNKKYKL